MDKLKRVLSGQDGNDDLNVLQAANEASSLSWSTRVKGFCACFALGVLCSILRCCKEKMKRFEEPVSKEAG